MKKKILIGSIIAVVLLILMPSIPAIGINDRDTFEETSSKGENFFSFVCGKFDEISVEHHYPGKTVEFTCEKGSVFYFRVYTQDIGGYLLWQYRGGRTLTYAYMEDFRGFRTAQRIIGFSTGYCRLLD